MREALHRCFIYLFNLLFEDQAFMNTNLYLVLECLLNQIKDT